MAVNQSRSMSAEFGQGTIDSSYISVIPDRGGVLGGVPSERLTWPSYGQAEQHQEPKFATDQGAHAGKGVERIR